MFFVCVFSVLEMLQNNAKKCILSEDVESGKVDDGKSEGGSSGNKSDKSLDGRLASYALSSLFLNVFYFSNQNFFNIFI